MSDLPTYDRFYVPILRELSDGATRTLRQVIEGVSDALHFDDQHRAAMLPSGAQRVIDNRIGWACSYLARVDALTKPARGRYVIADLGRELLRDHPDGISALELRSFAKDGDEWWIPRSRTSGGGAPVDLSAAAADADLDPVEQVERGIERVRDEVKAELLDRILGREPAFFERTVVDLLVAMGYGGAGGRAEATRLVGDGGIDGVIDQDVLGLDKVYVQAKRYRRDVVVQRPDLQGFVGALSGKADRGVFITTSRYTAGAIEWAERDARVRIILIDGERLVDLMVQYGVGVQVRRRLELVEIDEDFFE